jgi:hypothetical protein
MAVLPKPETREVFDAHRLAMIELMKDIDCRAGIVGEPTMTAQELRESQLARGIRAEDNLGSRELMRMRYGDDWDKE